MKNILKYDDEWNVFIGKAISDYMGKVDLSELKYFKQGKNLKEDINKPFTDYKTSSIHTFGHHIKFKNYHDFTEDILFGFNFGGFLADEYLIFTTEGIFYLTPSSENRQDKKGNIVSTVVYIPEFSYYTDLELKIVPKKKFFGGNSDKEAILELIVGSTQIEFTFKKEFELFLIELIDTIKKAKSNYEIDLTTRKSSLIDNLSFSITESKGFFDLLDEKESAITGIDPTVLKSLVKLANFLRMKEKQIKHETELLVLDAYEIRDLSVIQKHMIDQVNLYNEMYVLAINMVVSFIEKKTIVYYKIYEVFDNVGVFNSAWQNGISGVLSNIDTGIQDLIAQIDQLESTMISEIGILREDIIEKLDDYEATVSNSLGSIANRINYGNLLGTVKMLRGN